MVQKLTVRPTPLPGVLCLEPALYRDERGFFLESYNRQTYREAGVEVDFVQDNHSRSRRHVLRGIHYQDRSAPLVKLVRCSAGAILDVAVDLRLGAPTFGRCHLEELSGENQRQLLIPVGFGHAFLALSEAADVEYKCSGYYVPAAEGTVAWNDPEINVPWPVDAPIVSAKDAQGMTLQQYRQRPAFRYEAKS